MILPRKPSRGQTVRADLIGQIIDYMREITPVEGPNIRVSRGPGGSVISGRPGGGAGASADVAPWTVRKHSTEDDPDGKWEIWLPPGCMSVGGTLAPINLAASAASGHAADKAGWYLLALDEDEGAPTYTEETEGEGGETVTVAVREYDIVAHAKTSAKVDGVDGLDAPARRLLYVDARKRLGAGETRTAEEAAEGTWGDEFSQTVAVVTVRQTAGGTSRRVAQAASAPISVAGRARANFDLVWYLALDSAGSLSVTHVYCVRNETAIAGMTAEGPTMAEVTGAAASIYARIDTNAAAGAVVGTNVVSVVIDPEQASADQYVTWLKLYSMAYNAVTADLRASALVNVQVFR